MSSHEKGDSGGVSAAAGRMERFSYDDAIVRLFLGATLFWGVVATLVGVVIALQLAATPFVDRPGFEWLAFLAKTDILSFGRIRPLHTNAAIFAFAGNAIFAAIYYSTQRLCKTRMYSDALSRLHFWGWQGIIVCAALTLPMGVTQGKEYAELAWWIDILIAVVWVGFFGVNFFGTLAVRRERHMYVALWFYIATIVTVAVLHVGNSLAIPASMTTSYPIYAGVQDAFMQWWYGHNAVAFFLTTPFLGLMYYFLPKAAERPVFSYRLSIIHFWSLVFIYIWAGPHHLHYTALPAWASTLGMLFSVMLWMPSWGGMINGLMTLRGAWHKVREDVVLKFFVVGISFYGMSTFEGPLLSVKSVNALSHYTDWTIGHVHAGALGWNGFMTFGMAYWLMPRLFQTKLWSPRLAAAHFWTGTIGILMYVVPMYFAGITQGLMWRAFDESGVLKFPDFVETVMRIIPYYWLRLIGGSLFFSGTLMCLMNLVMTWRMRPVAYEVPVYEAPALARGFADDPAPQTALTNNTDWGKRLDVWTTGWWHRVWERLPGKFTVWVLIAVLVASLFEIVPTFLIRSNVPSIASVRPYTPLELAGRDIYISEGCYNCHSQMVRPIYAETKRYGEYSKPGEFVYDHPFQWGSRRIGPDLHREGGKQSNLWHMQHFMDPRLVTAKSPMPAYHWLLEQPLDFAGIQPRVRVMATLGVPYGSLVKEGQAEAAARAQAQALADNIRQQSKDAGGALPPEVLDGLEGKKVTALIAYLQRLGTDISAPPPSAAAVGAGASAAGDENSTTSRPISAAIGGGAR